MSKPWTEWLMEDEQLWVEQSEALDIILQRLAYRRKMHDLHYSRLQAYEQGGEPKPLFSKPTMKEMEMAAERFEELEADSEYLAMQKAREICEVEGCDWGPVEKEPQRAFPRVRCTRCKCSTANHSMKAAPPGETT